MAKGPLGATKSGNNRLMETCMEKNKDFDLEYKPDSEEVQDAIVFMSKCSENDLVDGWSRISTEWNLESVMKVHKSLCVSGRINELLKSFSLR
tara:strand:+ start:8894 stop:9172 length:279 start_codon:yes stop_codon:yes gene_type:complete